MPSCLPPDRRLFLTRGTDFADTAENITFSIEGGASVPVLRARLQKLDGEWVDADVNLAERIGNEDGRLSFGASPTVLSSWIGCVPLLNMPLIYGRLVFSHLACYSAH